MNALGTIQLHQGTVYGPVVSRRLGRSLGINLLPNEIKVCSLDCGYCQFSWTGILSCHPRHFSAFLPSRDEVLSSLESSLKTLAGEGAPPDRITFSGNGEPTLHPEFASLVDDVVSLRDIYAPSCRTAALSNSTTAFNPGIRSALLRLDEPMMKLDAGSEEVFLRVNRPARGVRFYEILKGLEAMGGGMVLQSIFVDGSVSNLSDEDVDDWCQAVRRIGPRAVQIYSLSRGTADRGLVSVPSEKLKAVSRRLEEIWGRPGEVYTFPLDEREEP